MPDLLLLWRVQAGVSVFTESGAIVIVAQLITSILVLCSIPYHIVLCMLAQIYVRSPTHLCCWFDY